MQDLDAVKADLGGVVNAFSMGYFSSLKCQYEYDDTASRMRGPVSTTVAAAGAASGAEQPLANAPAPATWSTPRRVIAGRVEDDMASMLEHFHNQHGPPIRGKESVDIRPRL